MDSKTRTPCAAGMRTHIFTQSSCPPPGPALAGRMTGSRGHPVRRSLSVQAQRPLEYWIARSNPKACTHLERQSQLSSLRTRLCKNSKTLNRERTSYSFESVFGAHTTSPFSSEAELENIILGALRVFEFLHGLERRDPYRVMLVSGKKKPSHRSCHKLKPVVMGPCVRRDDSEFVARQEHFTPDIGCVWRYAHALVRTQGPIPRIFVVGKIAVPPLLPQTPACGYGSLRSQGRQGVCDLNESLMIATPVTSHAPKRLSPLTRSPHRRRSCG